MFDDSFLRCKYARLCDGCLTQLLFLNSIERWTSVHAPLVARWAMEWTTENVCGRTYFMLGPIKRTVCFSAVVLMAWFWVGFAFGWWLGLSLSSACGGLTICGLWVYSIYICSITGGLNLVSYREDYPDTKFYREGSVPVGLLMGYALTFLL